MSEALIVAVISLLGTLLGSLTGILTANKLTNYRMDKIESSLEQLKKDHARLYDLEAHNKVQDQQILNLQNETKRIATKIEV